MIEFEAGNARNSRAIAKFSWAQIDRSCFDQRFLSISPES